MVAVAFILRSIVNRSRDVRRLFGRMGIFLALSGGVDALYYYGPGATENRRSGSICSGAGC